MTVVQLGPYPPPHGGVQTNLVAIRDQLRQEGMRALVINLTRHRKPSGDGVYYPKTAVGLVWLLLRLRYDIVHLHLGGSLPPRLVALALACTLVPGAKSVLTFHSGGYPSSPEGRTARPATLRGFVFRRFDCIIAVNPAIRDMFLKFAVPVERVRLIYPHPEVTRTGELTPELERFYGLHDPVLVTVGLLEPEYSLPWQIQILGLVRKQFPDAGLAIIGAGALETELRARIAEVAWRDHILLCGDVPHAVTLRAIAESVMLLRTTSFDGDSVAVREALALGVPVIATDNGMRPPGVKLVPLGDDEAICSMVAHCLRQPAGAPGSTGAGTNANVRDVLDQYRRLIGSG